MLSAERKLKIADIVSKNGGIKTSDLSSTFNVSEMTILRDLAMLEEQGILKRVYGGAVSIKSNTGEISSILRKRIHAPEKDVIGEKALDLITEGDSIFLDGSTTALALARRLYVMEDLVVVTNALEIINELRQNSNIELICTGGEFKKITADFLGPVAETTLKNYNADKAFISSTGISLKAGITVQNPLQASIKKIMIGNSAESILLVDCSKFDIVTLNKVCLLEEIDTIITDKKPGGNYLKFFKKNNIKILF